MIICRTPYRISFFGGGTDYPAWFRVHGGEVLATSIDKYCYLTCRYLPPFFEHSIRLVYRKIELCKGVEDIEHPAVRAVLKYLGIERGLELHHDGDLPARSGMGTSSAFTVGLLHALHALRGEMPTKKQLAQESIHVEQELLDETVGSQDQVLVAYGGFNHVRFLENGEIVVAPLTLPAARIHEFKAHLLLLYTGIMRTSADVADTYAQDMKSCARQLRLMQEMVREGIDILRGEKDIEAVGHLLHDAWEAKRSLSSRVSNQEIDSLYERALRAGAIGGKLTGAGGGGFLLLFVPPDRHAAVLDELRAQLHVPFEMESSGSQVLFYERGVDYETAEKARQNQPAMRFRELTQAA